MTIPGRAIRAADDYRYHSSHAREAQQLIKGITAASPGRQSRASFRQCDEYARDVLGSKIYAPWLKAYTVFSGTFKEGWIPDNYYGKVVVPTLEGGYGDVSNFKPLASTLFQTDLMPDLAYSVNGLLYTSAMEPVKPSELKKYLFGASERVVYKLDGGSRGQDVTVYDADSFPDGLTTFGNGIFQSYITQHPFFDAFSSGAVATIRITTVVDDESNVSSRTALVMFPRSTERHVRTANSVRVVVGPDGELYEHGYLADWVPLTRHPDSDVAFAHQVVPNFAGCVQACMSLHRKMMFCRLIGWDLTVDAYGSVKIMEWNGFHPGIRFSEAAAGPSFADLGWQNLWRDKPEAPRV